MISANKLSSLRSLLLLTVVLLLGYALFGRPATAPLAAATPAQNVILFVGDGMGPNHVVAGAMYATGTGSLNFQNFPSQTTMTHNNATGGTTDSAASASAMATGVKVNNGVISLALPGDGRELLTQLEAYKAAGKSTGLVSTSYITDATPAGFGAHETSRNNRANIFNDYINQTQPTLFFGGGSNGFDAAAAQTQGYAVVTDRAGLLGLNTETAVRVAGGFGGGELPAVGTPGRSTTLPTLPEMTETALNILDNDADGFFLLVEHEGVDNYSHAGDTAGMVRSVKELSEAVQKALDWKASHPNTLIVVLADHETGGLQVTQTNPQAGSVPSVSWSTTGHTQTAVPVFADGVGAEQFGGAQIDNTNVFNFLNLSGAAPTATPIPPTATAVPPTATSVGPTATTAPPTITPTTAPPTITPTTAPGGTIDVRVSSSSDDVEQLLSTGEMYLNSSDIELGNDFAYFGEQSVGLRFNNIAIPQGATISSAYVEFETDETSSESTSVTIAAQAVDNAPAFSSAAYDLTSRPLTAAGAAWNNIPAWNSVDEKHQSTDISAVLQEVIGRSGWQPNNSIVLVISGTGNRIAESYDGEAANAPLLHVAYTTTAAPTATAVPPTNTPVPPTNTPVPPTNTPVPPTSTPNPVTTHSFRNGSAPTSGYAGNTDTTLSQANPTTNYGNAADLLIDGDDPSGSGNDKAALLRWDISAIPPGSIVQGAELTLQVFNASPNTYGVYEIKRSWAENTATWQQAQSGTAWQSPGAAGTADRGSTLLGAITPTSTGAYAITLNSAGLALVQSWINNPAANYGLIIADAGQTDGIDAYSSETTTVANRPGLSIRTIPGPTPLPTATNTPLPTATNTPLPTATNTPLPTATNTPLPTATNTPLPTATNTPLPTATNTPLPTATNTPLPTATNTPLPTATNTPLPTATNTPLPTATNTPLPTATNTPLPTATNTPLPTATNTPLPTATNTPLPTATNTPLPTATNTPLPTATNTPLPTATNTPLPTATNTPLPTATNTPLPTATNTPLPTATNTPLPTATNTPLPTATNTPLPTATATPPPASGPRLQHGVVTNVGSSWKTVSLPVTYNSMVVVASANYDGTAVPAVVRLRNASGSSFEVRVDGADGGSPTNVTVTYTAVEEGVYTQAAHGIKMEAVKFTSTVTDHDSSWAGEARSYTNSYSAPVVVGQVMTYNDADWSTFWARGAGQGDPPSSSALRVGKHVGEDSDTTRADETIGYLVFETGSGTVSGVSYIAGLGADTVSGLSNSPPYSYAFSSTLNVQTAVVSQSGMDGVNGGWAILYGANAFTNDSIALAIDEDQSKDTERSHTSEQVAYVVFGEPLPVSAGPFLQTGVIPNVSSSGWTTVSLAHAYESMVVIASANYDASQAPTIVRVRANGSSAFDVRVDRADNSIAPLSGVPVHYAVVEEGRYTVANHGVKMEAVRFLSTTTDHDGSWQGENRPYLNTYSSPVVLGQVLSANDPAWSTFWARGTSATNPPNGVLYLGKHVGEDSDTTRGDELIGYIVIEAGSGLIEGQRYSAALGADTILGVTNSPPYSYSLSGLSSASVAIVSAAGMDGGNGGWPILYGPNPLSTSTLRLAFDEDMINDSERGHISEQVAYIIFE